MLITTRWCLAISMIAALVMASADAGDTKAKVPYEKHDVSALDAALRDVTSVGVKLYNEQNDHAGCYNLFRGALVSIRPFLAPNLQKTIDEGIAKAEKLPTFADRAFELRRVIDEVRTVTAMQAALAKSLQPDPEKKTEKKNEKVAEKKAEKKNEKTAEKKTEKKTLPAIEKFRVYLGTYTGKLSKGIYQCELDLKDGSLSTPQLAGEMNSPSFVAIHPNKKFLYAVGETGGKKAGVVAFAIDKKTGNLKRLNDASSGGSGPCHLVVDASGKTVLAANYGGGSCCSIPIDKDGKLLEGGSFHQHKGSSILPNQKGPHGHSINMDKANKFAFCADLGLDKILIYRLDAGKGTLEPHGEFSTPPGSGPRHFAFHPNGKWAYTNGEMSMTLIAMDYDAEKGALKQRQVISTIPAGDKKKQFSTAEVVVHPSGKFVYVSNRDAYNSIAIFSIDQKTGELKAVGHEDRGVKTPRNFAIEPTGQYMLVANQSGNNVISFRIDQKTGLLTPTGSSVEVGAPVCVRFLAMTK